MARFIIMRRFMDGGHFGPNPSEEGTTLDFLWCCGSKMDSQDLSMVLSEGWWTLVSKASSAGTFVSVVEAGETPRRRGQRCSDPPTWAEGDVHL